MRTKLRLGEILIQEGLLTEQQLQKALTDKRGTGLKLGQFLVRNNICKEEDIINMLSSQLRIDRYSPTRYPVDTSLAEIITSEQAREYNAVPVAKSGNILRVATPDPLDLESLDALEVTTGLEIEPVACTEADFEQVFGSLYGMYWNIEEVLEDVEQEAVNLEEDQGNEQQEVQDIHALEGEADQAPVIKLVNSILAQAVKQGASDVHLSPEKKRVQTRFRVDGKLREVPSPPKNMMSSIISRIKVLAGMDISVSRMPQDGRFTVGIKGREIHIRASCIPTIYGENVVLRLLDLSARAFNLEELGMNEDDFQKMQEIINKPYGMILSTGPTGSGKSTSLYAILRRINQPDVNIITLEDPVEYRVEGIRQVQLNTRSGMTFASGLRSILRQDPDVLMIGEMRDAETARIGVQAAMTGHRLLS
ncbi:MAG: GspE/PulE family protein, partial [Thermodesulfobacteriota bacterium]